jgi:AmmeMemoRadiSam system protein A
MGRVLGGYLFPHPPIILEEIGKGEEEKASGTIEGVKALAKDIKEKGPDTIILITPHGPLFADAISISIEEDLYGDFSSFGYGNLKFNYKNNLKLVNKIIHNSNKENIIIAEIDENFAKDYNIEKELDHGTLVPLYYVDKEYTDYNLIHITYGLLSPKDLYRFGKIINESVEDSEDNVVILASGDLSHRLSNKGPYPYSPYGEEFDKRIVDILKKGEMKSIITFDLNLSEKAGECGLRSLMILAGTLENYDIETKVLSYEGPYGVGYCTAKIDAKGKVENKDLLKIIDEEEAKKIQEIRNREDSYVKLARKSLEYYIKHGKYMTILENIDNSILKTRKGVFVSIKKEGMLRGCIGTIEPTEQNTGLEIIKNAVSAGLRDPRFDPVEEEELNSLVYSVDILSDPEPISSESQLDTRRYGVIVTKGHRRGLLLPNLEGVDTVEEQVSIALRKAGIKEAEDYTMERFEVIRHY